MAMSADDKRTGATEWVARHDTAVFVALTFGMSWPLWIASGALTRTPVRAPDLPWLVAQVGVFSPAFAGMAVAACVEPRSRPYSFASLAFVYLPATLLGVWFTRRGYASFVDLDPLATWAIVVLGAWTLVWFGAGRHRAISWPGRPASPADAAVWSLVGLLLPVALFVIAWALVGGVGGTHTGVGPMPTRDLTMTGVISALAVNHCYGGSLGEEPGWRGAWLPRLLRRHAPVTASLVISVWWALWHAPIDLSQGFGQKGVAALVVRQAFTLPITILFTWVTIRAGGSLLPPLAMHTGINAIPDFALVDPTRYERAIALLVVFIVIVVVAAAGTDPRLRREVAADAPGERPPDRGAGGGDRPLGPRP